MSLTMLSFISAPPTHIRGGWSFESPTARQSRSVLRSGCNRRFFGASGFSSAYSSAKSRSENICAQVGMDPHRRLSVGEVAVRAADHLLSSARASIAARGVFTVAVSGGSLPAQLVAGVRTEGPDALKAAEPEKWIVLFADERVVPLDHEDSNYRLVKESMKFVPEENIVAINPGLDVDKCAEDYESKVTKALSRSGDRFDAVYLGLGPDGHTASLFPGHALLSETEHMVAPISDSPKPPPERITLTLPVINKARAVAFVCTGDAKADPIKDIFENANSTLPGAMVMPDSGELDWFIDAPAASAMKSRI